MLQLVRRFLENAPAYCRRVNSALAIVKEVNKSCRATEPTASWKKASKIAQPDGIHYFLYVVRNYEELVGKPERA